MHRAALLSLSLALAACGGKIESVGGNRLPGSSGTSAPSPADPPAATPTGKPFDPAPAPPPAVTIKELEALCAKADRSATPTKLADGDALGKALLGSWYACDGAGVTDKLFDPAQRTGAVGLYFLGPGSAYWLRDQGGEVRPMLCLECTMRVKFMDASTLGVDGSEAVSVELFGVGVARMRRAGNPPPDYVFVRLPR